MSVTQPPKPLRATHIARFERLFRVVASLDVDKEDLRRFETFIESKLDDFLFRACEVALESGRAIVFSSDLPITRGLAACIDEFIRIDNELDLEPILDKLGKKAPQLGLEYAVEVYTRLPELAGGMSIALARSFRIIEPGIKAIATAHWERAFQLFDLAW